MGGLSGLAGMSGLHATHGPFHPKDIPGLVAWFDARAIGNLADAAAVSPWSDLTGNGNNATQATASQKPTYRRYEMDGRPALRFVATSTQYLATGAVAALDSDVQTIFVVVQDNDQSGSTHIWVRSGYTSGASAESDHLCGLFLTGGSIYGHARASAGAIKSSVKASSDQNPHVYCLAWDGANDVTLRQDSIASASASDATASPTGHIKTVIGENSRAAVSVPHSGLIAAVLLYNQALTSAQITQVENYLRARYYTPITRSARQTLWSSAGEPNWLGRPSLCDDGSKWIVVYRQANQHQVGSESVIHIRFSADEGATWTAADKYTDGGDVTVGGVAGPFNGHSTNDATEGYVFVAYNGELLCHVLEYPYGTYQYRSTDGGKTWTDEGKINNDATLVGAMEYVLIGTDTYMAAWTDDSGPPYNSVLYKSGDSGSTWTKVSDITSLVADVTNEPTIYHTGGNNLLAVLRDTAEVTTYLRRSADLGQTWGDLVDMGAAVGVVQRPKLRPDGNKANRIYLIGRDKTADWRTGIWISDDQGVTWSRVYWVDFIGDTDAAYCDMLQRADGSFYMLSYLGSFTAASIMEYVFSVA